MTSSLRTLINTTSSTRERPEGIYANDRPAGARQISRSDTQTVNAANGDGVA
ncbi:MAG TPA: hypothetical protein VHU90_03625 [Galbitalea sp.]|nr:hypothetical protein [Galbitalea sp.]